MRGSSAGEVGQRPDRGRRGRRRRDRCACATSRRAERGHQLRRTGGCRRAWRMMSASGEHAPRGAAEQAGRLRQHVDHHDPADQLGPARGDHHRERAAHRMADDRRADRAGGRRCSGRSRRRAAPRPGPARLPRAGSPAKPETWIEMVAIAGHRRAVARQTSRPEVRPGIRITSGPRPTTSTEKRVGCEALRRGGRADEERARGAERMRVRRFISSPLAGQV